MIPDSVEITPRMIVRHDEGLLYAVDDVRQSTTGYERNHELGGLVVNYKQLEQGIYPQGHPWSKSEEEFRTYFTVEDQSSQLPSEPTPEPIAIEPLDSEKRQPRADHWAANPQREAAAYALAGILKRGYTLTTTEVQAVLSVYDYSPKSPAYSSVGGPGFRKLLQSFGIALDLKKHKGQQIYTDGNLPPQDTDINETMSKIEATFKHRPQNRTKVQRQLGFHPETQHNH